MSLHTQTANDLLKEIAKGEISSQMVISDLEKQINISESTVHAFVRSQKIPPSQIPADSPVDLPIAVKDNLCLRDIETTCCSRILKNFRPSYNATVIDKLLDKGISIQGQTNMDEFAFGSSTENSCYGPTRNPWDTNRVPGGSSGGSAAAVAAREAIWSLGSDTGGSIRQPASFCGVVGSKPTYGRVSRYGLIAFASSLDQIGPITRDVYDNALLMEIISGYDPKDSTSVDIPVPTYTTTLEKDIKGLKIGIPKEYFIEGLEPDVKNTLFDALEVFKKLGAQIVDISLPNTEYCVATYYIIATAEASSNLARYDGVRYGLRSVPKEHRRSPIIDMFEETRSQGFGQECKRRVMLGTFCLSSGYYDAYYLRGQKVRTLIKRDFDRAFESVDAILTPTAPTTAFAIGEKSDDPLSMYLSDIYTISANLSGIPAISLPCGFCKKGLPIGMQIMTKPFAEEMMFRFAYNYEQQTTWHKVLPKSVVP